MRRRDLGQKQRERRDDARLLRQLGRLEHLSDGRHAHGRRRGQRGEAPEGRRGDRLWRRAWGGAHLSDGVDGHGNGRLVSAREQRHQRREASLSHGREKLGAPWHRPRCRAHQVARRRAQVREQLARDRADRRRGGERGEHPYARVREVRRVRGGGEEGGHGLGEELGAACGEREHHLQRGKRHLRPRRPREAAERPDHRADRISRGELEEERGSREDDGAVAGEQERVRRA